MKPTKDQFIAYQNMYDYYNDNLFSSQLPQVMLNFSREGRSIAGFVAPIKWMQGDNFIHELSITPNILERSRKLVIQTLVHEMCHIWQIEFGSPSRSGYHNKEWANKMEELGLMPSNTGEPGGKKTGQKMMDYLIKGAKVDVYLNEMPEEYWFPITECDPKRRLMILTGNNEIQIETAKKKRKIKYTCPQCKSNVWGKPNMVLFCGCKMVQFNESFN